MIHEITSSIPTFKSLKFKRGLNILVADVTQESTDKDTRNGVGKSTLLEVIHFLLGSNCDKSSLFRQAKIVNHSFSMTMDVQGQPVTLTRSGGDPSKVYIRGDISNWPVKVMETKDKALQYISNRHWKKVISSVIFGVDDFGFEKYKPSARSMTSYFVRRKAKGGFENIHKHFASQNSYDYQINLSYLLGLEWLVPREWQLIRDKEKALAALKNQLGPEGALGDIVGNPAELRSLIGIKKDQIQKIKGRLENFQIREEYHDIEAEIADISSQMNKIATEKTVAYEYLKSMSDATLQPIAPAAVLSDMYEKVGIELPSIAVKRFDDVVAFHKSVIKNRKAYLKEEIANITNTINIAVKEFSQLDNRRSKLLKQLDTSGALEQFNQLQVNAAQLQSEIGHYEQRLSIMQAVLEEKAVLEIERKTLFLKLQRKYLEVFKNVEHAVVLYSSISELLYEKPAILSVSETENGPEFSVFVHGERSAGINAMQIFCFDMLLSLIAIKRKMGLGFLVHDSHLFDPVDSRQVKAALELGARKSLEFNFQYIVTMNSDALPKDFDPSEFVLSPRLTDSSEDGGLFGFQFD